MASTVPGQQGFQATFQTTPHYNLMPEGTRRCIQECLSCFSVCEQTVVHCLRKGGRHASHERVKVLMDCSEICRTCVTVLSRGSDHQARWCALCAEICKASQDSCAQFGDDAQMKACADAFRSCSEACRTVGALV